MRESRNGPKKNRPMEEGGRLKGRGWKMREREDEKDQRAEMGRKETRKRRRVVGASIALGAWRRREGEIGVE